MILCIFWIIREILPWAVLSEMECEMSALNIPTVDYAHYQDSMHLSSIYTHLCSGNYLSGFTQSVLHISTVQDELNSDCLDKSHVVASLLSFIKVGLNHFTLHLNFPLFVITWVISRMPVKLSGERSLLCVYGIMNKTNPLNKDKRTHQQMYAANYKAFWEAFQSQSCIFFTEQVKYWSWTFNLW